MNLHYGYILCLGLLLLSSCSKLGPNADYYYPVHDLEDGLVYAYESVGQLPQPPHYWFYRSVKTADSLMLTSTFYSADLQPLQFVNERIVSTGSLLRDLRLYTPTDSTSLTTQASIQQPALFSFEEPSSDRVLVSVVSFRQNPTAANSAVYTLTRNRRYLKDTSLTVEGESVDAQVWLVNELTEHDSIGVLALESRSMEIYAENIGLAYRERVYSDGSVEAFRLSSRFSMDSLEVQATFINY